MRSFNADTPLRTDLPIIRFHDLRHTVASLMLNHGVPALGVSKILGHSSPNVTLNIYAHSTIDMQSIVHSGHELVFCLRGQLEYLVEKKIYQLETEDSPLFAEQLNHR
jgi:Phage integrase family